MHVWKSGGLLCVGCLFVFLSFQLRIGVCLLACDYNKHYFGLIWKQQMSQMKRSTFLVTSHSKSRCTLKGKKNLVSMQLSFLMRINEGEKTHRTISASVPSLQLLINIFLCSWNSYLTSSVLELSRKQMVIRVNTEFWKNSPLTGYCRHPFKLTHKGDLNEKLTGRKVSWRLQNW